MKATKRILSGLLVLAMVLALCPFMTFAEETTDAVVSIAAFTNGTVTADKESYKIGETVTLTIAPEAGYSQKLYINGEPLLLDWKTNVYSFVATEENYAITGGFVPTFVSSTHEKWDTANNAQGVLNTYYTSGDSSWLGIDSAAESITVKVKNYQLGDGTGVDGFHVLLGFKIKGTNYTFRVIKQSGKYYCQRAGFKNAEGKDQWTKFELDAATVAAILGDGVDFKLERIAANKLAAYVNGTKYDTFEIPNATAADAVTKIYIGHAGNLNEKIAIPYTVADPIFRVTGGDWNLDNQYDGSVTILNKTKDGSTIITNASDYKGVSVTVKDYLPTYDANGAITPNGFAMQFAFIFDNGKQYLVRLHNTDSNSPNYKLQNMGGTNCLTGWKWQADLNAAQKKNLLEGDGVKITVMLEGPNAVLYADGQKKATVPLGEEYAGKLVQIQLCMNGNKTGGNIEIPFELIKASEEHIHTPATAVVENKTDATCGADGSYDEVVKCECGHEISRTPKVIPATGAHIYDEGVVTKEPTYTETGVKTYTCEACGGTKTEDIPMLEKTVVDTKFTGKSLALEGAVTINLYVTYTVDGVTMNEDFVEANAGVLYWSVEDMPADRDAAILGTETHKADVKCAGVYQGNTEFFAMSHGIPAKCYGDTVYFRTYILVDGEYQYGEVEEYSILAYCENVFKNQNKPKLESALVALLNYESAAQTYFAKTGETPVLVNAGLETYLEDGWITADMLELSAADKVQTPLKGASAEMTVNFAQSGVMGGTSKSLALEGAIATNYYVAVTDHEVLANAQSEKAYFWTEAKYNELQAAGIPLSKENASYVVDAQLTYSTRYGYEYFVASEQVPAPEWGNTQYMATVITDANGVDHCSGVIIYSPLEYAAYLLNNGVANREDPVCEWLIAYSHRAIIALGR